MYEKPSTEYEQNNIMMVIINDSNNNATIHVVRILQLHVHIPIKGHHRAIKWT